MGNSKGLKTLSEEKQNIKYQSTIISKIMDFQVIHHYTYIRPMLPLSLLLILMAYSGSNFSTFIIFKATIGQKSVKNFSQNFSFLSFLNFL